MKKTALSLTLLSTLAFSGDYTNSIGMKFKDIPAGSFTMGANIDCPKDNPFTEKNEYTECIEANGYYKSETPAHRVTLKSFYLGETEVTQGQWYAVMGSNPSKFKTGDENLPVEQVSWYDAKNFVDTLNKREKTTKYRLPTEKEWEYAARAGTTTKWSCGDYESCLDDIAWYTKNSGDKTHTVATKSPNAWGLYDMSGNVWEWTDSCWTSDYNSGQECKYRSYRGGGWGNDAVNTRSASRYSSAPGSRDDGTGFRLLRTK
jgi:formylglycine-generating enzyme required for sulfatase activity